MVDRTWLVFDVESIGLHGEGWAVGWVYGVITAPIEGPIREFVVQEEGLVYCDPVVANGQDDDLSWVLANCHHDDYDHFGAREVSKPRDVRSAFWEVYQDLGGRDNPSLLMAADCTWPVESGFLSTMIMDREMERRWAGPYPLIDITTLRFAVGFDPLARADRRENELPVHNPLADARQSARLLADCLGATP